MAQCQVIQAATAVHENDAGVPVAAIRPEQVGGDFLIAVVVGDLLNQDVVVDRDIQPPVFPPAVIPPPLLFILGIQVSYPTLVLHVSPICGTGRRRDE